MNFKKATDDLLSSISHEQLAEALGVSVASVRQARLAEDALAHRRPPKGWEAVVAQLAKQKAEHFRRLAERLSR
jgi:DNA-binding GntR family transcriptional regulator